MIYRLNLHTAYNNALIQTTIQGVIILVVKYFILLYVRTATVLFRIYPNGGTIQDTEHKQPIPFIDGDRISFKITIHPAPNQHLLTGTSDISPRSYHIQLYLTSRYEFIKYKTHRYE